MNDQEIKRLLIEWHNDVDQMSTQELMRLEGKVLEVAAFLGATIGVRQIEGNPEIPEDEKASHYPGLNELIQYERYSRDEIDPYTDDRTIEQRDAEEAEEQAKEEYKNRWGLMPGEHHPDCMCDVCTYGADQAKWLNNPSEY